MTACTRRDNPMKSIALALAVVSMFVMAPARAQETPLLLEKKISLGEVRGRIDHLAVDLKRNRLFVATGHGLFAVYTNAKGAIGG